MRIFRLAAILAAVVWASAGARTQVTAAASEAKKPVSYIFASPHNTSRLSGETASKRLQSFEERNAVSVADRIVCSFSHPAQIFGTLGIFNGDTENSFVVEARLTQAQVEYAASLLGEYGRQEFVLWFMPKSGGRDVLWTIHLTGENWKDVASLLEQLHVSGATIRTERDSTEMWIVDFGGRLGRSPETLIARLRGSTKSDEGVAALIGNDDLSKAAALFRKNIASFEASTGSRLSSKLESSLWRNATSRTCSSEIAY